MEPEKHLPVVEPDVWQALSGIVTGHLTNLDIIRYSDGEMSDKERAVTDIHLKICTEDCRARLVEWQELTTDPDGLFAPVPLQVPEMERIASSTLLKQFRIWITGIFRRRQYESAYAGSAPDSREQAPFTGVEILHQGSQDRLDYCLYIEGGVPKLKLETRNPDFAGQELRVELTVTPSDPQSNSTVWTWEQTFKLAEDWNTWSDTRQIKAGDKPIGDDAFDLKISVHKADE